MARPKAKELTPRELAVMHVFWDRGEATAEDVRQALVESGEQIAYVTVANVVRGLTEKRVLKQTTKTRPFHYRAAKSFDDVSKSLVGDLVSRLFSGSRQAMLVQLLSREALSDDEREYLEEVLRRSDAEEEQRHDG